MLDGSPELTTLALRLHEAHGLEPIPRVELEAAILAVAQPSSEEVSLAAWVDDYVAALGRAGYLEETPRGLVLGGRAREYAVDREREIRADIERLARDLGALFAPSPEEPAAEPGDDVDIDVVTRAFLEDVLAGTDVGEPLVERILATFERHGRLLMSRDGRRYRIVLFEEGEP